MKRRQFIWAGIGIPLAGCTGSEETGPKDSDGDGMIDSRDYAPQDSEVQEKEDLNKNSNEGANTGEKDGETSTEMKTTSTIESSTAESPTTEPETEFPSHSGTHSISGGEDFWSLELDIPVDFEIQYTVTNRKSKKYDFDVFVFSSAEYDDYKAKAGGGRTNPDAINKASVENVKEAGKRTAVLSAGVYYFVVDNTDIGNAGDWGTEATRKVYVELFTNRIK